MSRIWNYVKEVERGLPRDRRIVIAGELHATLKQKLHAMEQSLGRKPTEAEVERMLADFGEPDAVALRYVGAGASHPLVERYLTAVEQRLPGGQAQDILAELREAIDSRIDQHVEQAGAPPDRDQVAAIIKDFGHPVVAAQRYSGRDTLISRDLSPWFWPAQRIVLGAGAALVVALAVLRMTGERNPWQEAARIWSQLWETSIFLFGAVTLIFLLMDGSGLVRRMLERWDPRALPADHVRKPKTILETLFSILFDVIFIAWWIGLVDLSGLLAPVRGVEPSYVLSPVWGEVHLAVLALAILQTLTHAADLIQPAWTRARAVVSILGHAAGLAVLAKIGAAGDLLVVNLAAQEAERMARAETWAETTLSVALAVTAIIWVAAIVVEAMRLAGSMRPQRRRSAALPG